MITPYSGAIIMTDKKAAIYHFTDESTKRPNIYIKQIRALESYGMSLGYEIVDIFCDKSLLRYQRNEFDRLISISEEYDAIICKDYYHISKNTMQCMKIVSNLNKKGVKIIT